LDEIRARRIGGAADRVSPSFRDLPGVRRFFHHEASPARVEQAIDDELRFHFDMTIAGLTARGHTLDEARAEAARRFGDFGGTRQMLREIDRGRLVQERRAAWLSSLWQDAKYAMRGIRSQPAFSAIVIATLGLGIGANAAMFGIVDRLMLRAPAHLTNPWLTHRLYLRRVIQGKPGTTTNTSYRFFQELSTQTSSFEKMAAFLVADMAVGRGEESRERRVAMVTGTYWGLFDVRPFLGRFFGPSEDEPLRGSRVAVLSYPYWVSQYGSADVIGKTLEIGSLTYDIIGVAAEGFTGMDDSPVAFVPLTVAGADMWGPSSTNRLFTTYDMSWLELVAVRKPGVPVEQASADASAVFRNMIVQRSNERSAREQQPTIVLGSVIRERGPQSRASSKLAVWLVGVAAIVLVIACANVANLLLARALRRRREIAVRIALGVGRTRLISQLFIESALLAALGAIAALGIAHWGSKVLRLAFVPEADWGQPLADSRILLFTLGTTILACIFTGTVPAIQASRPQLTDSLKAGGREGGVHRARTRTALLLFQSALSVILLVGAGLFVRSLGNVESLELGYDPERVLYVSPEMRGVQLSGDETIALKRGLLERAQNIPGVESAARTWGVPFWQTIQLDIFVPGIDSAGRLGEFVLNVVSPSYFATMGTRILRGRGISLEDRVGAPQVMVVSEQMARKLWPNEDALGKCVKVDSDTVPCTTVVGIAQGIRRGGLDNDEMLQYYLAIEQYRPRAGGFFVRTRGEASRSVEMVRREMQRGMPGLSYLKVIPMSQILEPNTRSWRLGARLFALFGGLALLLAAIGLFGVLSYDVAQRRHEMGVRIALGAQRSDVLRLVVERGTLLTAAALAIGATIALWAGRFVEPLLFHVSPRDPMIYLAVVGTLLLVAIVASAWPAMRAARVDPNEALRTD
jgi:putative ABC transport system permease protein